MQGNPPADAPDVPDAPKVTWMHGKRLDGTPDVPYTPKRPEYKSSVLILYDRCRMTLVLPLYFAEMPMEKIRKVFKLLRDRAWQNDEAWETLDAFFPAWREELLDKLERLKAELSTAKRDAEEKRRTLAALGSAYDEHVQQARNRIAEGKKWLAHAKKRRKPKPEELDEINAAMKKLQNTLDNAMRPKTDHDKAIKEMKRLERAVKAAEAATERGNKVINAYEAINDYEALKA